MNVAREAGQYIGMQEVVRRIMHRLLSSTNRRMHKGVPDMLTHLLRKPMGYCSREFYCYVHSRLGDGFEDLHCHKDHILQLHSAPQIKPEDYACRPAQLERFPLYIFLSSCVPTKELGPRSMEWVTLVTGETRCSHKKEPIKSHVVPELCLVYSSWQPLSEYEFYVHLLTESAWHVPIICGKLPRVPDADAAAYEKGMYGLWLMLLFRPHRRVDGLIGFVIGKNDVRGSDDDVWDAVSKEFRRWRREDIDHVAAPYFEKTSTSRGTSPRFDSPEWWACLISERLRNYDATMANHIDESLGQPQNVLDLQAFRGSLVPPEDEKKAPADADSQSNASLPTGFDPADIVDGNEPREQRRQPGVDVPLATHCGELPEGRRVEYFHVPPSRIHACSMEGRYWQ